MYTLPSNTLTSTSKIILPFHYIHYRNRRVILNH